MKVTLEENYRSYYTLDDLDRAKAVIAYEKDDEYTPAKWLEYAATEVLKWRANEGFGEVIHAKARTARNSRAWNAYGEDTGNMDVWIEGLVKTCYGYTEIGAYLSDIWQSGADDYSNNLWFQYYGMSPLPG